MAANPLRAALYAKLTGDSTLTALLSDPAAIFHQRAPQEAGTPFVVFARQAGTPVWSMAGTPLQTDLWLIKAVGRGGSASDAETIAARIDTVLNDAQLTVTGRTHLYLRRESDVDYQEDDGAEQFHHAGALYRIVTA